MEHVNHPKHYNSHPNGIECIDVIRHYTCDIANAVKYLWRAGLKTEMGMEDAEKEIEDMRKAIFYIEDYQKKCVGLAPFKGVKRDDAPFPGTTLVRKRHGVTRLTVKDVTGYSIGDIASVYVEPIMKAFYCLLLVGIIRDGHVLSCEDWQQRLEWAKDDIRQRIRDIESNKQKTPEL